MRELMLELLTWAPFEKLVLEEKEYIDEILSGNYQQPPSMFHDLFLGFRDYVDCVQKREATDIGWLRNWKANHGRAHLPLLFKKICFYLMVRGALSESAFMEQIGLHVSRIRKWNISPQFRKYAEADTYSAIRSFRNGVKKKYIVSTVKKLYYEAGRQVSKSKSESKIQSMTLSKLPQFVDVFAGTASVAASVVSDGCPRPIINDYDPLMICFVWAFTYHQKELRSRIADLHNWLMKKDFSSTNWHYKKATYEYHQEHKGSLVRLRPGKYWGDKSGDYWQEQRNTNEKLWDNYWVKRGHSESYIKKRKKKARRYQEFIMRIRSLYLAAKAEMDSCDRDKLRNIDFNTLSKNKIDSQVDAIIEYALAVFLFYSFSPSGKNVFYVTCVDENKYFAYLNSLKADLKTAKRKDQPLKAWALTKLRLHPASLKLQFTGDFSRHLRNAEFNCKGFEKILKESPANSIYYLDSPYFLTAGYKVPFSDDDHKKMLDTLRNAKFKWIFSIQYKPSNEGASTSEKRRRHQPPVIQNYGDYYRGFYLPFTLNVDLYVPKDDPELTPTNLFAILFDFDAVKKKGQTMNRGTTEMLVVNFNCLPAIPLHDPAVVLPFDLFLQCADAGIAYSEIVQRAIAWRKINIERDYTRKAPV